MARIYHRPTASNCYDLFSPDISLKLFDYGTVHSREEVEEKKKELTILWEKQLPTDSQRYSEAKGGKCRNSRAAGS